jgi:hypothetical protein
VCASASLVSACTKQGASEPPRSLVDAARAYQRATLGSAGKLAPAELERALEELKRAHAAYGAGASDAEVSEFAAAVQRDVAAAEQRAAERTAAAAASAWQASASDREASARSVAPARPVEREDNASESLPPAPVFTPPALTKPIWPDLTAALTTNDRGIRDAALVVAIEDYAFLSDVLGAQRNGEDWFRYLTSVRGVPLAHTRLLFNGEATDYAILSSLQEVAGQVEAGGRLWFVFIGHGAPSESVKDGLLVAVDAQQTARGIEQRSVRQGDVLATMNKGAGTPVVILDACYSGRGTDGSTLVAGLQPTRVVVAPVPKDAVVISAAASNEYAGPLPGDQRPAFSYLALGGLRGWADDDRDGKVTAAEVASYARGTLRLLLGASRSQSPEARGRADVELSRAREPGPDLGELLLALRRPR